MSENESRLVQSLERVIRLLADVWPADRENLAVAGAEFEELAAELANAVGLRSLIDVTWQGLMHLYQTDDYFISVKTSTMQGVNLIREYQLRGGEVQIEDVESICDSIERALRGESESADSLIEQDEGEPADNGDPVAGEPAGTGDADQDEPAGIVVPAEGEMAGKDSPDQDKPAGAGDADCDEPNDTGERYTLDDLAASVMDLDEGAINKEELESLEGMIRFLLNQTSEAQAVPLNEVLDVVQEMLSPEGDSRPGWLSRVAELTERAIQIASDESWDVAPENEDSEGEVFDGMASDGEASDGEASDGEASGETNSRPPSTGASPSSEDRSASDLESITPPVAAPAPGSAPAGGEVFTLPEDIEGDMIDEFVSECDDLIGTAESALLDLEETPDDDELVNTVFRAFHTIKGTSAFMGLAPVSEFTHSVETMLSMVREGDLQFDAACADLSFRSIDVLKEMLSVIESAGGGDPLRLPPDHDRLTKVLQQVSLKGVKPAEALSSGGAISSSAEPADPEPQKSEGLTSEGWVETETAAEQVNAERALSGETPQEDVSKRSGGSKRSESDSSVRVNVSRLDRLVDMVGELVIAHSVVAQDSVLSQDVELQKKVAHASKILRELQDTSLTLRMVPLKATFQKMNRLVRDLSRKAGKPVTFSTLGEDTEIDRNMVDVINEPLVHMLRNALDHGIEDPEARRETDKPEVATIWFRAFQAGGKVVIEIEDDGRGIDKEKILEKAVSKGLVDPDARLTDREIFNLIFRPGFSSVEKVTDLSGRGVGMDVVRRSIEQLQGKIDVSSELGSGTRISLEIPFTLAITDGMLVRVGSQRFIIPIINIDTAFRATEEGLKTVMGNSEQVMFQGKTIPVMRLHRLFNIPDAIEDLLEGTLLVVRSSSSRYALFVDDVIGQKQLVGKSIDMKVKANHISGGAILEDGQVGLILDTAAIANK